MRGRLRRGRFGREFTLGQPALREPGLQRVDYLLAVGV